MSSPINLDTLERTLLFLEISEGTDESTINLIRLYLPIANGTAPANPALLRAMEKKVGGQLEVGTLPIAADPRTVVNRDDWTWCWNALRLGRFVATEGRMPKLSESDNEGGSHLGMWLHRQRADFRTGKLSPERVGRLNSIDPDWAAGQADAWERNARRLDSFFAEHQRVPKKSESDNEGGAHLGAWLHTQRNAFRAGKLSPERLTRLNSIDLD